MNIIQPKTITIIGDETTTEKTIKILKEEGYILTSIEKSKKIEGKIISKLIIKEEI